MTSTFSVVQYKIWTMAHYRKIVSNDALSNESGSSLSIALNLMQHLFLAHLMNRL